MRGVLCIHRQAVHTVHRLSKNRMVLEELAPGVCIASADGVARMLTALVLDCTVCETGKNGWLLEHQK